MSILNTLKFISNHPLNKDNKIKSVARFVSWQVRSRLVPGAIVYDWINGSKFLVKTGETGLTGNIYTGLHEFPDMAFLLHVLSDDDLFIDVGANVGSYTILACSAIGARGYAIEPVPSTFRRLMENMRLNKIEDRVTCLNIGVGREKGSVAFTSDSDTTNHALASGEYSDNKIIVEVSTLDTVLEKEQPSLMKIDVEGYETLVLEGAKEILNNQSLHSVIMELNGSGSHYGFDESRILKIMLDYGFCTYAYDPFNRILVNLQGKNLNSGNTLFIRDEQFVLDRLRNSPEVTVQGKKF